jgi:hypothetical protein
MESRDTPSIGRMGPPRAAKTCGVLPSNSNTATEASAVRLKDKKSEYGSIHNGWDSARSIDRISTKPGFGVEIAAETARKTGSGQESPLHVMHPTMARLIAQCYVERDGRSVVNFMGRYRATKLEMDRSNSIKSMSSLEPMALPPIPALGSGTVASFLAGGPAKQLELAGLVVGGGLGRMPPTDVRSALQEYSQSLEIHGGAVNGSIGTPRAAVAATRRRIR